MSAIQVACINRRAVLRADYDRAFANWVETVAILKRRPFDEESLAAAGRAELEYRKTRDRLFRHLASDCRLPAPRSLFRSQSA
jgi:hypothetical protein